MATKTAAAEAVNHVYTHGHVTTEGKPDGKVKQEPGSGPQPNLGAPMKASVPDQSVVIQGFVFAKPDKNSNGSYAFSILLIPNYNRYMEPEVNRIFLQKEYRRVPGPLLFGKFKLQGLKFMLKIKSGQKFKPTNISFDMSSGKHVQRNFNLTLDKPYHFEIYMNGTKQDVGVQATKTKHREYYIPNFGH